MKKSVFLFSLLVSLSSLGNGLDQLDLSGNLRIEYGKNVYHKFCQNIEKSTSGQDLERVKGELAADMQRQNLKGAVKFFNCPIAATGGRLSEFIYIAKNASNASVLVVANPMQDQVYEIVASEQGKIWFGIPRSDLNGTLMINPENQAN